MGAPINEIGAWAAFCRDVAQWGLIGHGAWAIDLTATGKLVGQVGLNGHPYFPEKELGWMLLPQGEGQGIAAEAAHAVRDWAYKTLRLTTLVSYIHHDNTPSIRPSVWPNGLVQRSILMPQCALMPTTSSFVIQIHSQRLVAMHCRQYLDFKRLQ